MGIISITFTDSTRSGTSAKGNPYLFQEGFLHVEDKPFPLQCQFFVDHVIPAGEYQVAYQITVDQGRPQLTFDFKGMKRV